MQKSHFFLSVLLSQILVACSSIDVSLHSSVQLPPRFEQEINTANSHLQQWWTFWQDPQLTQLIEQALSHNLDIAKAQARLAQAQAISHLAQADKGPSVGLQGTLGRLDTQLRDLPIIGDEHNRIQGAGAMLVASWEPDFFGQKKSDAQAAMYAALGQQEQLYATKLTIVSLVAQSYFQFNATQQLITILNQNIATLQQLQRYVEGRFQAGYTTQYDVHEINNKILNAKALQAPLQAQADGLQRRIAVLLGQTPEGFSLQFNPQVLQYVPPTPSGQLPGAVMTRRPDIQAYAMAVQARAAQLASAKADLFPRFDIQFLGQGGRISLSSDLSSFSGANSLISAGVQLPIFTNGRIQANIDATDAKLKESLIDYDQALLKALAEVESYYQQQYALEQKVQLLSRSVSQHQRQAIQAEKLFQHGNKTLDHTLTARLDSLASQQELIQAQLQRQENLILLYKALGGGWR